VNLLPFPGSICKNLFATCILKCLTAQIDGGIMNADPQSIQMLTRTPFVVIETWVFQKQEDNSHYVRQCHSNEKAFCKRHQATTPSIPDSFATHTASFRSSYHHFPWGFGVCRSKRKKERERERESE